MDVGNKTLAELSEEAKEKRYVTLEVGAKVSGYTKEYLEHLCRLNKVEFRLWNGGQFVIELESLLSETHTILLSYEDINFVDKETLDDPISQFVTQILTARGGGTEPIAIATATLALGEVQEKLKQKIHDGITQSIPTFGEMNQFPESLEAEPTLSRVGHSIVSDPLHVQVPPPENEVRIPLPKTEVVDAVLPGENPLRAPTHVPINAPIASPVAAAQSKLHQPFHLRVTGEGVPAVLPEQQVTTETTPTPTEIRGVAADDSSVITPTLPRFEVRTLELHPIETAVDASEHHDDAPLFPLIQKITEVASLGDYVASENSDSLPGIPYLGEDSRTVIFSGIESPAGDKAIYHPLYAPNPRSSMLRPPMLPIVKTDHQLVLRETHSLVRSPALNIAFVACLMFTSLAIGGFFSETTSLFPRENIATVVSALSAETEPENTMSPTIASNEQQVPTAETFMLPFSDDVIISTSTTPNTVIVQPVFNGVPGQKFEYVIVPVTKTE